jgi:hypothetical protein
MGMAMSLGAKRSCLNNLVPCEENGYRTSLSLKRIVLIKGQEAIKASIEGMKKLAQDNLQYQIAPNPNKKSLKARVAEVMELLPKREKDIVRKTWGLEGKRLSFEEVAKLYDVTRERIRQIEHKACRQLRHPHILMAMWGSKPQYFKRWREICEIHDYQFRVALSLLNLETDLGRMAAERLPEFFTTSKTEGVGPVPLSALRLRAQDNARGYGSKFSNGHLVSYDAVQAFNIPVFDWDGKEVVVVENNYGCGPFCRERRNHIP